MEETMNEFWKQMLASILRKILFATGGWALSRGWIDQSLADQLTSPSVAWYLAGVVLIAGSIIWQYAKIKFNDTALIAGIDAPSGTPPEVVKTDVMSETSFVVKH